jgi:hypothetical protein
MDKSFTINAEQMAKIAKWAKEQDRLYKKVHSNTGPFLYGAIGGELTYSFTPTSIGLIIEVEHATGAVLDVSDYEDW